MSLLQKMTANSTLIDQKMAHLSTLIQAAKSGISSAAKEEKQRLEKENEQLKQEISSLVQQLNQLEGDKGPHGEVFRLKPAADAVKSKTQAAPTPAAPATAPVTKAAETKPQSEKKSAGKGQAKTEDRPVDVSRLDFRVGKIISARKHPEADSLYVEEVDLGEGKNRTVVSGLVKFVPLEEMQQRLVLLLCNLKPAKMRGVTSEAMVMCASTPEKVEILTPPAGASIGDRASVAGYPGEPDQQLNPKKKIWEECAPHLATDAAGIACYKGTPIEIPGKGPFTSTMKNVTVK